MADWITHGSGITVTPNASTVQAPNGSNSAIRFVRGDAEAWMYRVDEVTCKAEKPYVFSIFAKLDGIERVAVRIGLGSDDNYIEATYDLTNNTIVEGPLKDGQQVTDSYEASLTSVGDLWYALSLEIRFREDEDINIYVTTRDGGVSIKGDDSDGVSQVGYFWNPTVEQRSIDVDQSYLGSAYFGTTQAPKDTYVRFPFWGANTSSVTYLTDEGTPRVITPTSLNDFSTETAVEYFRIPLSSNDGFPNSVQIQDNTGGLRDVRIDRDDIYSKYDPILVSFVNKQGVIEGFWFLRRSDYSLKVKEDSFYKNLIDYDTMSYSTHAHSNRKYNIVGQKSAKLNTGFVPQEMNVFIEEMKMSEQVWITNSEGTHPVNMSRSTFKYQTHINDKLIQHEIEFEFANRLDNTIV